MVICVYGSASDKIDKKYIEDGYEVSYKLGKKGHSLVFGAGAQGLMGAAARGFKDAGAYIHGVLPAFFYESKAEGLYDKCDKVSVTKTMSERKDIMENECDAFVITPGGVGTFDELFQILTLKQLGRHSKAIAILNTNGYYNWLIDMMNKCVEMKFINKNLLDLFKFFDTPDQLIEYVENYKADDRGWQLFKKV